MTADSGRATLRLDKWLWHARFFKTRSLAAKQVSEGKVRVNSTRVSKPSRAVGAGDTLTFQQAREIRVVRILALGVRRGPATEAQALYEDLSPPKPKQETASSAESKPEERGGPRPTKKDRRAMEQTRERSVEPPRRIP